MSAWTDFAKKVMKRDKISYTEALKVASKEYKKGKADTTTTKKPTKATKKSSKSKKDMGEK